ncbi:MAG: hypothetical protein MUP55_03465 [Candidatus Aenigmarchaeota archaeon]|nr:hypothetical protein [Candidatus Aenigmarchaeota archaeon]
MKSWKYAAIGLGSLLAAFYINNVERTHNLVLEPVERTPYKTEKKLVRNHAERDLSFIKTTQYYDEGPVAETSGCSFSEGSEALYLSIKRKDGTIKNFVLSDACSECHKKTQARQSG